MIKNIIYQYLRDKKESDNKVERNPEYQYHWSPSYYVRCLRQTYYKKIGAPISNTITIHSLLKMDMGKGIHEQLKKLYREMAAFYGDDRFRYIEPEKEYMETEWDGIVFVYQPDDIIQVGDRVILLENKTTYGRGIKSIKENGVSDDYEIQAFLYMIFEKKEYGEIYFIATDSSFNQDFEYTYDALKAKHKEYMIDRNKKIRKVIEDVKTYYKTGEKILPDREGAAVFKNYKGTIESSFTKDKVFYSTKFPCAWGENRCSYFNMCWHKELDKMKENSYYVDGQFIK